LTPYRNSDVIPLPLRTGDESIGPAYFLTDAHLGIESPQLESAKLGDLLAFLAHLNRRCSTLFLVGDLFDFWFEYPGRAPTRHREVLCALSELSQSGTVVQFLGGNHDYWAGTQLERLTGATVHREPVSATCFGTRLFVAHGDGLPRGDRGYRMLKAVIRSRPAIAGFSVIPPALGERIARWASGLSDITEERIRRAIPPMRDFLEEKLAEGYQAALVGHVHRQLMWEFPDGVAIVVGDWMTNRSVVELGPGGFRLLEWRDGTLGPAARRSGRTEPAAVSASSTTESDAV
jgi:UDP-2,3-diacylglucosamine hydrolase